MLGHCHFCPKIDGVQYGNTQQSAVVSYMERVEQARTITFSSIPAACRGRDDGLFVPRFVFVDDIFGIKRPMRGEFGPVYRSSLRRL